MGNTKLVAFEGWCAPDAIPTREQILELVHGTYAALEVDPKGYLGSDDGGDPCEATRATARQAQQPPSLAVRHESAQAPRRDHDEGPPTGMERPELSGR